MVYNRLNKLEREAIIRGFKNGMSYKDLGKQFDVRRTTIVMCIKRLANRIDLNLKKDQ